MVDKDDEWQSASYISNPMPWSLTTGFVSLRSISAAFCLWVVFKSW